MTGSLQQERVSFLTISEIGTDDRGETFGFHLCRSQQDFILLKRKAGSISGNSYHTGKNSATNPKVFVLLDGSIEFVYRYIHDEEKIVEFVSRPSIIEVQPYVVHSVHVVEDCIMLEANSLDDIIKDRIREVA